MNKSILFNSIIVFVVMFCAISFATKQDDVEEYNEPEEISEIEVIKTVKPVKPKVIEQSEHVEPANNDAWSSDEKYLLAKIAMAEAEGCDTQTKAYVIMTVLNRVKSNKFPNTIKEVIYERHGSTYQFSPIGDGRWNRVEPNDDCWKAVEIALSSDTSQGALFFESCTNKDNWHSRNLQFLYESNGVRFYK